jgi:hypothetical protein
VKLQFADVLYAAFILSHIAWLTQLLKFGYHLTFDVSICRIRQQYDSYTLTVLSDLVIGASYRNLANIASLAGKIVRTATLHYF